MGVEVAGEIDTSFYLQSDIVDDFAVIGRITDNDVYLLGEISIDGISLSSDITNSFDIFGAINQDDIFTEGLIDTHISVIGTI